MHYQCACVCVCVYICHTRDKPCSNYCYLQRLTLSFSSLPLLSPLSPPFLFSLFYVSTWSLHSLLSFLILFVPYLPFTPSFTSLFHLLSSCTPLIPTPPSSRADISIDTKSLHLPRHSSANLTVAPPIVDTSYRKLLSDTYFSNYKPFFFFFFL